MCRDIYQNLCNCLPVKVTRGNPRKIIGIMLILKDLERFALGLMGVKIKFCPSRRTFAVLLYRNHKEKCEKIGNIPQDPPPPARLSETCKTI